MKTERNTVSQTSPAAQEPSLFELMADASQLPVDHADTRSEAAKDRMEAVIQKLRGEPNDLTENVLVELGVNPDHPVTPVRFSENLLNRLSLANVPQ